MLCTGQLPRCRRTAALAQSAAATLRGQVAGSPAGTEVVAKNVATGAVRRTQTAANGSYTLVGLEPGTYTVEAGNGASQTVRLSVASTATLNLECRLSTGGRRGTTLGTITVTAPALEDVKTSEVGKTVSLRQIQTTPQVSRNFLEFADAVPGMVFSATRAAARRCAAARRTPAASTSTSTASDRRATSRKAASRASSSAGQSIPAAGDRRIQGHHLELQGRVRPDLQRGRHGGDQVGHQRVPRRGVRPYTNDNMRAKTPCREASREGQDRVAARRNTASRSAVRSSRTRCISSSPTRASDSICRRRLPRRDAARRALLPPDVAAQFGPASLPFKEDLYFGKIDWEITDSDRLELSGQGRKETQDDNIGGSKSRPHGIVSDNYDKRVDVPLAAQRGSLVQRGLADAREDSFNNPSPISFGNGFVLHTDGPQRPDDHRRRSGASPLAAQNKGQKGWSIEDNLTFNSFDWHGDHTVKMGVKYKDIDLTRAGRARTSIRSSTSRRDAAGTPGSIPTRRSSPTGAGPGGCRNVATNAKQFGTYIQDDWDVNDKLMLNLGVRWDYEKNPGVSRLRDAGQRRRLPQQSRIRTRRPGRPMHRRWPMAASTSTITSATATIARRRRTSGSRASASPTTGWRPEARDPRWRRPLLRPRPLRLHAAGDHQDGAAAVHGLLRDPATGACRGDPCYDWDPNYLNGLGNLQGLVQAGNGGEVDLLNNKLKVPYSDQFSLGMSNTIGEWQTDATISRILSHDGFAFTLGNRYPNGDFFQNGGQPWGNGVPGFGALIIGSNGIATKTTQVLLSAREALFERFRTGARRSPIRIPTLTRTGTSTSIIRSMRRPSATTPSSDRMRWPSIASW